MTEPKVGSQVHFTAFESNACRYAVVTRVRSPRDVDLCVFEPEGTFFRHEVRVDAPDNRRGTWHWPEDTE